MKARLWRAVRCLSGDEISAAQDALVKFGFIALIRAELRPVKSCFVLKIRFLLIFAVFQRSESVCNMAERSAQYKNQGKDAETLRKSRAEQAVSLRKEKREDILSKRRNIPQFPDE